MQESTHIPQRQACSESHAAHALAPRSAAGGAAKQALNDPKRYRHSKPLQCFSETTCCSVAVLTPRGCEVALTDANPEWLLGMACLLVVRDGGDVSLQMRTLNPRAFVSCCSVTAVGNKIVRLVGGVLVVLAKVNPPPLHDFKLERRWCFRPIDGMHTGPSYIERLLAQPKKKAKHAGSPKLRYWREPRFKESTAPTFKVYV